MFVLGGKEYSKEWKPSKRSTRKKVALVISPGSPKKTPGTHSSSVNGQSLGSKNVVPQILCLGLFTFCPPSRCHRLAMRGPENWYLVAGSQATLRYFQDIEEQLSYAAPSENHPTSNPQATNILMLPSPETFGNGLDTKVIDHGVLQAELSQGHIDLQGLHDRLAQAAQAHRRRRIHSRSVAGNWRNGVLGILCRI